MPPKRRRSILDLPECESALSDGGYHSDNPLPVSPATLSSPRRASSVPTPQTPSRLPTTHVPSSPYSAVETTPRGPRKRGRPYLRRNGPGRRKRQRNNDPSPISAPQFETPAAEHMESMPDAGDADGWDRGAEDRDQETATEEDTPASGAPETGQEMARDVSDEDLWMQRSVRAEEKAATRERDRAFEEGRQASVDDYGRT